MRALILALFLGGCSLLRPDRTGCDAVADHDPAIEDYAAKTAATPEFGRNHYEDIRIARVLAIQKCERERGIIPSGGGVEQPRAPR